MYNREVASNYVLGGQTGEKNGSRKEVHEPKVHNVWGTEFGAHNQWSTEPMEHRVIRCTGFWSTTFGAQNHWSTGLFGAHDKWGTGLAKYF